VAEHVFTGEVDRILDNDEGVLDPLVHEEADKEIVVCQSRFSELNVSTVYDRIKIAILSELEISIKTKVEILEGELDGTFSWQKPCVQMLVR
jgi:hypothetical protein